MYAIRSYYVKLPMSECLGIYILGDEIIKRIKRKSKQKEVNLSYDILQELSKENKISSYDIGIVRNNFV